MPTLITNPSAGDLTVVDKYHIVEGGTGGTTDAEALGNLGGIPATLKGMPNGPIPLDQNRMIPVEYLSGLNPTSIGIYGPTTVQANSTNVYQLTNHDSYTTYTVSATDGVVTYNGSSGTIFYVAPNNAGNFGFTVSGRFIAITVVEGLIHTPTIVSPADDFLPSSGVVTVQGSNFSCVDTGPVYETFTAADLEISTTPDFTALTKAVYGNPSTTFTLTGYSPDFTTYMRIRYHGTERVSEWSNTLKIQAVPSYIVTPVITSPGQGSVAGYGEPSDPLYQTVAVTIQAAGFSTSNLNDSFVSSDIEISTTIDFSNIIASTYGNTSAERSWEAHNLQYNTLYFVRMKHRGAKKESTWSNTVSFSTMSDNRYIAQPVNLTATLVPSETTLTYTLSASAFQAVNHTDTMVSATWQVATDAGFSNIIHNAVTGGSTVFHPAFSSTYYVRVIYTGHVKTSTWSGTLTLNTAADDRIVNTPVITVPTQGATGININTTINTNNFSVSSSSVSYTDSHLATDWEISTNPEFTNVVRSSYNDASNKSTWSPATLDYSASYNVRARHRGAVKVSNWSAGVYFTAMADNRTIQTPSVSVQNAGSAALQPAIYGSAFTPVNYSDSHVSSDWQIATDAGFSNIVASVSASSSLTSWSPSIPLAYATSYYVRVRYNATIKSSGWSVGAYFATMADNRAVATPTIWSASGSNSGLSTVTPVFDSSNFIAVNYSDSHVSTRWQLATDAGFSNVISDTGWLAASTHFTPTYSLAFGTTYYIRVAYAGNVKISDWSAGYAFTTMATVQITRSGQRMGFDGNTFWPTAMYDLNFFDPTGTYHYLIGASGNAGEINRIVGIWVTAVPSVSGGFRFSLQAVATEGGGTSGQWYIEVNDSTPEFDVVRMTGWSYIGRSWYGSDCHVAIRFVDFDSANKTLKIALEYTAYQGDVNAIRSVTFAIPVIM